MPVFQFTTFIDIEAEDYDSAISWFDYKTKDLNTYVSDIEEK
jgi:hypothetical protein